jgi:hypothetical protein
VIEFLLFVTICDANWLRQALETSPPFGSTCPLWEVGFLD